MSNRRQRRQAEARDGGGRATGLHRSALDAALTELSQAGFIVTAESGPLSLVALSSAWRRT
jgi:hypothetical protein